MKKIPLILLEKMMCSIAPQDTQVIFTNRKIYQLKNEKKAYKSNKQFESILTPTGILKFSSGTDPTS